MSPILQLTLRAPQETTRLSVAATITYCVLSATAMVPQYAKILLRCDKAPRHSGDTLISGL